MYLLIYLLLSKQLNQLLGMDNAFKNLCRLTNAHYFCVKLSDCGFFYRNEKADRDLKCLLLIRRSGIPKFLGHCCASNNRAPGSWACWCAMIHRG
jgi:hypothetical protein